MKRKGIAFLWALASLGSLLFGQTGPGGVGSTDGSSALTLWLKVDAGLDYDGPSSDIEAWEDQSGNLNSVSQDTPSRMPEEVTTVLNGFSVLRFERSDDNFLESATFPLSQQDSLSVIMVFSIADTVKNRAVFASRNADGIIGMQLSPDSAARFSYKGNGGNSEDLGDATDYSNHCIFYLTRNTAEEVNAWCDGTQILTNEPSHVNMGQGFEIFKFGTNFDGNKHTDMDLAEAVIFFDDNNEAERIIVQNYLSSKYDLAITSDDYYDGDLAGNGDFDYDVIGIGASGGYSHDYSESPSGFALRAKSGFADGDFVFTGHDNTTNDLNTTDVGGVAGLLGRWERTWYANVTGSGATEMVDVSFDFSEAGIALTPGAAANYRLLYRSGTSGSWNSLGAADSVSGDRVYFADADLGGAGDVYLTLGSTHLGVSPLPVELLSFTAEVKDFEVNLEWETATEQNSSHFNIERTVDGFNWEAIGTVAAAGTTSEHQYYHFTDPNPGAVNYYRLHQVDLDGKFEYSHLVAVKLPWVNQLNLFPNPAIDKLYVGEIGAEALIEVEVLSLDGQLLRKTTIVSGQALDITDLASGTYLVTLQDGLRRATSRVQVQR